MSLVRRGKNVYLYTSVRNAGRVTSVYRGSGPLAVLAQQVEDLERAEIRRRRAEERAALARDRAEDAPAVAMCEAIELVARDALVANGCYRHARGQWRRRGTMNSTSTIATTKSKPPAVMPPVPVPGPEIPVAELLKRAKAGDPTVVLRLRALLERGLDRDPRCQRREVAWFLDMALARSVAGEDLLLQEVTLRDLRRTTDALAGPEAPALEQLLAHRIAATSLDVNCKHMAMAVAESEAKGASLATMERLSARLDASQRRFLQASKMLATVRRLGVRGPAVAIQVNQTMNVGDPP